MRAFFCLLTVIMCASCTTRPNITFVDPVTGVTTTLDLGGTVMAETDGVLASIKHGQTEMKYSSIREDSTKVPKHALTIAGAAVGGIIMNKGEAIREGTKQVAVKEGTKVELGKQSVEKFGIGEETKKFIHATPNPNLK